MIININFNKEVKTVNISEVPKTCKTIFIKNLPYDITESEIGDKFRPFGEIKSIRLVYNSHHKNFKGFCFVEYVDRASVLKALTLNGKEIKGRVMHIDFEAGGPKQGYHYRSEAPSKFNSE